MISLRSTLINTYYDISFVCMNVPKYGFNMKNEKKYFVDVQKIMSGAQHD